MFFIEEEQILKRMKLVRERLDFDREGETLQKVGVGVKRSGQPKSFEDAQKGDTTIDYNGFEGELIDKITINIGPDGMPDEDGEDFIDTYDSTGIGNDIFRQAGFEYGDTMEMIATKDDEGDTLVWDYGPDGAYAIW